MSACCYEVTAHAASPPERVFTLLADATSWPRWAGFLVADASWEREGIPPPGGAGAIRKLGRWPMYGREEILAYEPPAHLAYTIVRGQPVRNYRADVMLTRDGNGTLITWAATFDPLIPGTGTLVTAFFRRIITTFANGLADYAVKQWSETPACRVMNRPGKVGGSGVPSVRWSRLVGFSCCGCW
jgi:uncharacterized protein YndB with AHSA1/START domain